jgi:hypothetical protein
VARTDWQTAWTELQGWIAAEKPGYGRQELLEKMAQLAKDEMVPEALVERAVRVHGLPALLQFMPEITPDDRPSVDAAASHPQGDGIGASDEPEEVHDGTDTRGSKVPTPA